MVSHSQERIDKDNEFSRKVFQNHVIQFLKDHTKQFPNTEGWHLVDDYAKTPKNRKGSRQAQMVGFFQDLDRQSGIDATYNRGSLGQQSFALRVSKYHPKYDHRMFSIRYKKFNRTGDNTEWAKRVHAIQNHLIYPQWTMQIHYLKHSDEVVDLAVAMVPTLRLFQVAQKLKKEGTIKEINWGNAIALGVEYEHFSDNEEFFYWSNIKGCRTT